MVTKVLTVRGRTGWVLAMVPVPDEQSAVIAQALEASLPAAAFSQVRLVHTDDPSPKLLAALENVFPNLAYLCLDPTHLPMTFEYGSSRKRAAASRVLRAMMAKFTAAPSEMHAPVPSVPFKGLNAQPLSLAESNKRDLIQTGGMPERRAREILASLDPHLPWQSRYCFIEAMAALARLHPQEMARKIPGPNKTGHQLLFNATAPSRFGWFFNNIQARRMLPERYAALLPSGTTSNEALHAEVKAWFRQTQAMHRSTLSLKLHILRFGKALPHFLALQKPTVRQIDPGVVLARAAAQSPWNTKAWSEFAQTCEKASLPLNEKRSAEVLQEKTHALKRPASLQKRPAAAKSRRTPFNKPRKSALRLMGKKAT